MKGNRGADGVQLPTVEVPLTFGSDAPPPPPPRRRRTALVLAGLLAVVVLGLSAALAVWLVERDDSGVTAEPTEPPTPIVAPSPTTTPAAVSATGDDRRRDAEIDGHGDSDTDARPSPTVPPSPTPTTNPLAPPAARVRYVVQSGDSCDGLRQKFQFAGADFLNFQAALGALTGRTAATRCVMNVGEVLCVPAQADLARLDALKRDDACLNGELTKRLRKWHETSDLGRRWRHSVSSPFSRG